MSAQRISLDDSLWISFHVLCKWIMIGLERRKSSWVFRRWFPGFPKLAIRHSIFTHAMDFVSLFQVELVSAWLKFICFELESLNFSSHKQPRSCKYTQMDLKQNCSSGSESLLLEHSLTDFLSVEDSFLPGEISLVHWDKDKHAKR